MNEQFKAFRVSIYIHALFLFLIMAAGRSMERFTPPIVIDFSLETLRPAARPRQAVAPPPKAQPRKRPKPVVRKVVREEKAVVPKAEPKPALAEAPAKEPEPVTPEPDRVMAEEVMPYTPPPEQDYALEADGSDGVPEDLAPDAPAADLSAEEVLEGTRSIYRMEHFVRIRDMIVKNIRYPLMARRMGLEGQVKVSFIVCRNGDVKEVKVQESSGAPILDNQAVQAVMQASPFPGPPVEVQLVVPISYKLS